MERVFDFQFDKVKTKLMKICSLIEEQYELIHEAFKKYDSSFIDKIVGKNSEIKQLKESVEVNCQKIFVLTQPVATDLRDVLLLLKINVIFKNYNDSIVDLITLVEKHSVSRFEEDLTDIYEASYSTLDLIKSSFDSFIVNDTQLAKRIIATESRFDDMIETNSGFLQKIVKDKPENAGAVFNILAFLNELSHMKKYSIELCRDIISLNEKKEQL